MDDKADVAIPVEYTVGATFTVRLPSSIELANNAGSWDYSGTVGVKGDIDSGKVVKVTPAEFITMYDVTNRPTDDVPESADDQAYDHKDAKDTTVAQTKQQWGMTELSADTYSDTDLTLTAGAMQSGKWKGLLPVEIQYGAPAAEAVTLTAGLYDAEGNMTSSWDDLVSSGLVKVTNNVIQKCDTSVSGKLVLPEEITGMVSTSSYTNGAFYNCKKLTEVVLPSTMTSIGNYAFYGCSNLTSITIPDGVTSIGGSAFYNCSKLTSVTIPDGVTSIGDSAFSYCSNLTSATFNTTSGWYVGSSAGAKDTALSDTDLADTSTAATYLKSTYYSKYWTRE